MLRLQMGWFGTRKRPGHHDRGASGEGRQAHGVGHPTRLTVVWGEVRHGLRLTASLHHVRDAVMK